jgi:hypothetical protein
MKRSLLMVFVLVGIAGASNAGWDRIFLFSNASATDAFFLDRGSLVPVYIWHMNSNGATASQWMLDVTAADWTHLGDQPGFQLVLGTSIAGASFSYESCLYGSFLLMTVNFMGSNAPNCTEIRIVAAPEKAGVQIIDCDENEVLVQGGMGIVNADQTCDSFPVESTTWGRVKALYR